MLCYEDIEQTSVEWLWFHYTPFGKLTIIQGNPGEGKTYFAMMLTAACTNRKLFSNMEDIEPFNVIYQTAEDGMGDTIKPRLVEAGADVDMNRANEVRPVFRKLGMIAEKTGCAIVLIGHLNKSSGTQSTYRGLGSIDIMAAVRSLIFIGKVRKDPTARVLIHEKSSLAPPGETMAFKLGDEESFRWVGAYEISADELLDGKEGKAVYKCICDYARVCFKNHSCNLHAPLYGIFCLHSVDVARYAALIQTKSPINCDIYLAESIFKTRSRKHKMTVTEVVLQGLEKVLNRPE